MLQPSGMANLVYVGKGRPSVHHHCISITGLAFDEGCGRSRDPWIADGSVVMGLLCGRGNRSNAAEGELAAERKLGHVIKKCTSLSIMWA